jgi:ubiquinol-cytochrome c reductase iron-sulfur subunit
VGFVVSALASFGLAAVYAAGGQVQAEGALLAVALGGLGYGFVMWGHHLSPTGPFEEERHPLPTTPEDRHAFAGDFGREKAVGRRSFVKRALLAAAGALGLAALFPVWSLGPNPGKSLLRTPWRRGLRLITEDGQAVKADEIPIGGLVTAFPEGHPESADGQAVIVRVSNDALAPTPGRESWSPEGIIAYSKVCTHAGCAVGLFDVESNTLFCPCHQSAFDVLESGRVVFGPAARALPQLPISIDADGHLVAQGDFSDPVGPAWWTRPAADDDERQAGP